MEKTGSCHTATKLSVNVLSVQCILEDDLHFHVGMWHIANVRAIGSSSHALSSSMLSCMALH